VSLRFFVARWRPEQMGDLMSGITRVLKELQIP